MHNTDIWWNMLIKFSKPIGNSFTQIINTEVNSKPCQTSEMKLFPQVVTGFRGERRILPYISDEAFYKKSQKIKSRFAILQEPPSWMFDNFLNILLNWLPKLRMFHL